MKVLLAASEAIPFIKTGGLADVAGTLVDEFNRSSGVEASVILPLYRDIRKKAQDYNLRPMEFEKKISLGSQSMPLRLWRGETPSGSAAYFIENDSYYDRDDLYGTPAGDYPDNIYRFTFFSRAVCEFVRASEHRFDVIHCNDWQTGLIPVYARTLYRNEFQKTAVIITLHNLGYQGIFPSRDMPVTGLGWEFFTIDCLEFYGKINLLKGGILFSDLITTVSKTYSREILTGEYGYGLEGVLASRSGDLYGIINGINYKEWNPEEDPFLESRYSGKDPSQKKRCKRALQVLCGLPESDAMLVGMVSRFSTQKGLDLVAEAAEDMIRSGVNIVLLGKGDKSLQDTFLSLGDKYRKKISVTLGFDNVFAHRIYAGSDVFLMPSRYEPCGLGQLIALRYGTIPIARKTGGLADTIREFSPSTGKGTGFLFKRYSSEGLMAAIRKALGVFTYSALWLRVQRNAMLQDFSWHSSAEKYLSLYRKALKEKV